MSKLYDDAALAHEYEQCRKLRIVAQKYGCSDETVRRAAIKYGVERVRKRPKTIKRPKADEQELRLIVNEYYDTDATINDLAEKYHRAQYVISNAIHEYGSGLKHCAFNLPKITDDELIEACKTLSIKEIAEKYGMHPQSIPRRCRRLGCYPVGYITKFENKEKPKAQRKKAEARAGFCAICGSPFTTLYTSQVTCGGDDCKRKYKLISHRERNERNRERYKEANKARREFKAIEKRFYNAIHTVERECVVCGEKFFCLDSESNKTCSAKCSRELSNTHKDRRIPKAQRVDTITLKRLYKRDGGKCYLCGGLCNWDDWNTSKNGNEYPGDTYPTVDHVVPVSKGGLDSWENVRLAHWKCNLEKADGVIETEPLEKEFAYSQKHSKVLRRKTAQYTLDGKLIKIWDSTAQIRRELGMNDKHIQDVCRGRKSRTGNAYGYHWEYLEEVSNA